jgi:hypothetical protein
MANNEHLSILRRGVESWNSWRRHNSDVRPDLSAADLTQTDLRQVDLSQAYLHDANFGEADLRAANLNGADLSDANFREADLRGANLSSASLILSDLGGSMLCGADLRRALLAWVDLTRADLSGASLERAFLYGANLTGAVLTDADLTAARIGRTVFADLDLSRVRGLESAEHRGPSTIGIDTIYRSKGDIPHAFLRSAGVPDSLIEGMAALIGATQPIQFYSCFISHSHRDKGFARLLHRRLREKGLRVWHDEEDLRGGRKTHQQIQAAVEEYDRLIVVLSEASMQSEWVETEIHYARQREVEEHRTVLFPIRLCDFETIQQWQAFDSDHGKDMAREVREYPISDFSGWQDDEELEKALERLARDLTKE